mgnify:FL=1
MAHDSELEALLDEATRTWSGVQKKKMFGGLVFTTGGNICVGIWRDHLIIRAGEAAEKLMAADTRFRPFDVTGRTMKGWAMLGPEGWRDGRVRSAAVARARAFCRTLPDKS